MAMPEEQLTQPLRREQERLQRSMQFLDQLVSGQVPDVLGTPRLSDWNRVLGILGDVMRDYGPQAIAPEAWNRWVDPAFQMPTQVRNQAMNLLAQQGAMTGQLDPRIQQFMTGGTPGTLADIQARSQMLASMAPQFAAEPWFQQAYQQHLGQVAPSGQVMGQPVSHWAAAASPFFEMQAAFGGPQGYAAAGLPQVQFPMDDTGMTRRAQDLVSGIHQAALASAGEVLGPQGPVRQTPREIIDEIFGSVGEASQFFSPQSGMPTAPPFDPRSATPPPASSGPGGASRFQEAGQNVLGTMFGFSPPQPGRSTAPPPGAPNPQVEAIKNELQNMGASSNWTILELMRLRPQLTQAFGEEGWQQLMQWAQLNLQTAPAWAPPGGISPLQAAISVATRQR